jgi:hypothetical protein
MGPDDNKPGDAGLFNIATDALKCGEPWGAYLEQYKIYLDHLDKLSDRRQSAHSFFFTLNTGLCAALAFLLSRDTSCEMRPLCFVIPFAGIMVCFFWYRLVKSYRQLSAGKFEVVHQMEKHLPMAPYKAEWALLGQGKDASKYRPLTHVEVWVPLCFTIMYALLLGYLLLGRQSHLY